MGLRRILLTITLLGLASQAAPARAAGCSLGKVADLPVTMTGLQPMVTAKVNGVEAPFIFDSGSFFSTLTPAGAAKFGMRPGPAPSNLVVRGLGGEAHVQMAVAREFGFADMTFHRVDFLVAEKGFGGGAVGLIGRNIFPSLDIEYDLANGVIRLFQTEGCKDAALAYWATTSGYSVVNIDRTDLHDPHIRGSASVNGVKVRFMLDTGSGNSMLGLAAAARAGVTPKSPGVVSAGVSSGLGLRSYMETWIAPVSSFSVGDETINHTRLRIGDMDLWDDSEMLLGADFFLSHRIFVANSEHKVYFTYNGGPVFNLNMKPQNTTVASAAPGADKFADTPTDAVGFSRRAAAFTARLDYARAIDDLTRAIALDPASPDYVFQRGMARMSARQPVLAMADFDQVLKLRPDDVAATMARAQLRLGARDLDGAQADLAAADRLAEKNPDLRLRLATAYVRAGLPKESIGQYDQWIAGHPKDDQLSEALTGRCWVRALWGLDLDKARADCDAALRLTPGSPPILNSRGLVRLRLGEFDRAIADYDGALRLEPSNPWALYGRGLAKLRKGLKDEGEADLKAATTLRPRLPDEAKARGLTP